MKNLNYLRLVLDKDGNEVERKSLRTRVHQEPAMPDDIERVQDGVWQQVTHGQVSTVIKTWWMTGAARMVA